MLTAIPAIAMSILLADGNSMRKGDMTRHKACLIDNSGKLVEIIPSPSLLDLRLYPERYDGCTVLVEGVLGTYEFPTARLFLSTEDQRMRGKLFGGLLLTLGAKMLKMNDEIKQAQGRIVLVQGRFSVTQTGIGSMTQIERFEIQAWPLAEKQ
jgi:hypothetical protein